MHSCDHAADNSSAAPIIDIRGLPCARRRNTIFAVFGMLAAGERLELINDHDPLGLRDFLDGAAPGAFGWDYVAVGPDAWRVAITRL